MDIKVYEWRLDRELVEHHEVEDTEYCESNGYEMNDKVMEKLNELRKGEKAEIDSEGLCGQPLLEGVLQATGR